MKRWILALVTLAAVVMFAGTASAQGFGGHGHYGGYDCDYGYGGYGGYQGGYGPGLYSSGYRGLNIGYGGLNFSYGYQPRWHDTSHLHYHPGHFQRHGHHYHYVPGHYDVHRSGHWHP